MFGVLIVCCVVPFATLSVGVLFARRRATRRVRAVELVERENAVFETSRILVDASRRSSAAVIAALDASIRERHGEIDAVLAFAPRGEELACVYASGERSEHFTNARLRRDALHHLPSRAASAGHRASGREGLMIPTDRRGLAVPMHDEGGLRAVIYVSSSDASSVLAEDAIVRTIAHAVSPYALALEREADRAHATYDALTGLLTPRAFRERLSTELGRVRAGAAPGPVYSLWFIDTDHFKRVNDMYGHAAGDTVLQKMAAVIRAHTVAEIDIVGRNGGDEFCALILEAQKTVAIERAQELCEAVRKLHVGLPLTMSASIGVASFPHDAQTWSDLLEVADAAMYHSKRSGRDRVAFAVNGKSFSVYR